MHGGVDSGYIKMLVCGQRHTLSQKMYSIQYNSDSFICNFEYIHIPYLGKDTPYLGISRKEKGVSLLRSQYYIWVTISTRPLHLLIHFLPETIPRCATVCRDQQVKCIGYTKSGPANTDCSCNSSKCNAKYVQREAVIPGKLYTAHSNSTDISCVV